MNEQRKKQPFDQVVDAAELKERCLELVSEIYQGGGALVITECGRPVAKLTRYVEISNPSRGAFKDIKILGDIEGPMPAEWYTDPAVQTDDDWNISGPMPASWFTVPDDVRQSEYQVPELIDVSILHRHKLLTLDTDELLAQLEEIITAISESTDGKVVIFDDERPLVELTAARKS